MRSEGLRWTLVAALTCAPWAWLCSPDRPSCAHIMPHPIIGRTDIEDIFPAPLIAGITEGYGGGGRRGSYTRKMPNWSKASLFERILLGLQYTFLLQTLKFWRMQYGLFSAPLSRISSEIRANSTFFSSHL